MTVASLLKAYHDARAAWHIADPDANANGPEWLAYEAAENAIFRHPCQSLADVQAKARAILDDDVLFDSMTNCWLGQDHVSVILLRSFVQTPERGGA